LPVQGLATCWQTLNNARLMIDGRTMDMESDPRSAGRKAQPVKATRAIHPDGTANNNDDIAEPVVGDSG
jgi:hypothetical protein